jgi:hypothetical protein
MRVVTIGVYGWTEARFFAALAAARVTTFVDIRRRRGLRGPLYAFANSRHLQRRLAELGIRYAHALELAPTEQMLGAQHAVDRKGAGVRKRTELSAEYLREFGTRVLARFDPKAFLARFDEPRATVCLFCVEDDPAVCHRSLVAGKIEAAGAVAVTHLRPAP